MICRAEISAEVCGCVQVTSLRHVPVVAAVRVTPVAGHANAALEHSGDLELGTPAIYVTNPEQRGDTRHGALQLLAPHPGAAARPGAGPGLGPAEEDAGAEEGGLGPGLQHHAAQRRPPAEAGAGGQEEAGPGLARTAAARPRAAAAATQTLHRQPDSGGQT